MPLRVTKSPLCRVRGKQDINLQGELIVSHMEVILAHVCQVTRELPVFPSMQLGNR